MTENQRADLRRTWELMFQPGEVVEIRAFSVPSSDGKWPRNAYGYFDNPEVFVKAALNLDARKAEAVYFTPNPIMRDLLARANNRIKVLTRNDPTTTDDQVIARRWLLIDVDPIRPSGISATDSEHEFAIAIGEAVREYLRAVGWPDPIMADSGNGCHLNYRIDLPNDVPSRDLCHKCLLALGKEFNSAQAHLDPVVYNAARIWKLYGTTARKGDPTADRPHRVSRLLAVPETVLEVSREKLEALAAKAPAPAQPSAAPRPTGAPADSTSPADRVRKYLEKVPPPITGQGSNQAVFKAGAVATRDFALSVAEAVPIVLEWALAGDPTWTTDQVTQIVEKSARNAKKTSGTKNRDLPPRETRQDYPERDKPAQDPKPPKAPAPIPEIPAEKTHNPEQVRGFYNPARDTDMGNAERLIDQAGHLLRYTRELGWLAWDGKRWSINEEAVRQSYKEHVPPAIYREVANAAANHDQNLMRSLVRWAKRSEESGRLTGTLTMARCDPRVIITQASLDRDPWIFNCENGTVDLRSGQFRAHRQEDYSTKLGKVTFDSSAKCPLWEKFLHRIFEGKLALIKFVQRCAGLSLTGSVQEQVVFLCYGTGKNGKSVFLETIADLTGDYSAETPAETLMAKQTGSENNATNDLARLMGVRMVTANETSEGGRLAESKVKMMSGDDVIVARYLFKEYFEFRPQFKLWIRTNHKPAIRGADEGIWRRIMMIPFTVWIPEAERDLQLREKLRSEWPGIFNWLLAGCLDWQRRGLSPCTEVTDAIASYRTEQDLFGQFLTERCTVCKNGMVSSGSLYKAYKEWSEEAGERPVSQRRLGQILIERGMIAKRGTGGTRMWHGLHLQDHPEFAWGEDDQPPTEEREPAPLAGSLII